MFTPTEDKSETLPDGRTIQTAIKGVPMLEADARRAGLLPAEDGAAQTAVVPEVHAPTAYATGSPLPGTVVPKAGGMASKKPSTAAPSPDNSFNDANTNDKGK